MTYFRGVAAKAGVSQDEIGAVMGLVMAVSAGRVRAQAGEALAKDDGGG